jgi:hypothetical protein
MVSTVSRTGADCNSASAGRGVDTGCANQSWSKNHSKLTLPWVTAAPPCARSM